MSAIFFFKMMRDRQKVKQHPGRRHHCHNNFKSGNRRYVIKRYVIYLMSFLSSKKDIK